MTVTMFTTVPKPGNTAASAGGVVEGGAGESGGVRGVEHGRTLPGTSGSWHHRPASIERCADVLSAGKQPQRTSRAEPPVADRLKPIRLAVSVRIALVLDELVGDLARLSDEEV